MHTPPTPPRLRFGFRDPLREGSAVAGSVVSAAGILCGAAPAAAGVTAAADAAEELPVALVLAATVVSIRVLRRSISSMG